MSRQVSSGIDVGSHQTKVMITEPVIGSLLPRIIGVGIVESRGLRKGFVVNTEEVAKSVKHAINQAEKTAGIEIKRASLSVGGVGVNAFTQIGATAISRADLEITNLDINKAEKTAGIEIKRASLSVGGVGVNAFTQIGATAISRADLEITNLDINKAE